MNTNYNTTLEQRLEGMEQEVKEPIANAEVLEALVAMQTEAYANGLAAGKRIRAAAEKMAEARTVA